MLLAIFATVIGTLLLWLLLRSIIYLVKFSDDWAKGNRPNFLTSRLTCERCETRVSRGERIRSFREYFLGGWTCPNCGSEYDQIDNLRFARSHDEHLRDLKKRDSKKRKVETLNDGKSRVQRLIDE